MVCAISQRSTKEVTACGKANQRFCISIKQYTRLQERIPLRSTLKDSLCWMDLSRSSTSKYGIRWRSASDAPFVWEEPVAPRALAFTALTAGSQESIFRNSTTQGSVTDSFPSR